MERFPVVPYYPLGRGVEELREQYDGAIKDVLDSGRFIGGPAVESFEDSFASFSQARFFVGVGTGLDAIELSLRACGIGPDDEVIVPGFTFAATLLGVIRCGAIPVAVDVQADTATLCPSEVAAAITPMTKAIVAVHLHGFQAPMRDLRSIADEHGLALIEDAAQAHGSRRDGFAVGQWSDAAAYSFYPSKNLGAFGDAGGVSTDNEGLARRIRTMANYGSTTSKYSHEEIGFNSRLDPIQAALLAVSLERLNEWNARRRVLAARYASAIVDSPSLRLIPRHRHDHEGVWHHFIVLSDNRERLREFLESRGVETEIHYPTAAYTLSAFDAIRGLGSGAAGRLPVADILAEQTLSLPLHPWVTSLEAEQVVSALEDWSNEHVM